MKSPADFWTYQPPFIEFLLRTPRAAGFMDMGAGKTVSVLTAFARKQQSFDAHRGLICGPLRVVSQTWPDEIAEWSHLRHLKYHMLSGSAKSMARQIALRIFTVDLFGISCDSLHVLASIYVARLHPFDFMVLDESTRYKTRGARRAQAARLLTIHPQTLIALTGTPRPNGVQDLHHQVYLLDRGKRLGSTMAEFKARFYPRSSTGGIGKTIDAHGEEKVAKAIADICYVLRPEQCEGSVLPEYNPVKLDMPEALAQQYKTFEKSFVLQLADQEKITAINTAGIGKKLLQFASGAVYNAQRIPKHVHDIKLEALREIAQDNEGKPLLIAYNFIHEIERIKSVLPGAVVLGKDPQQIRDWNAGKIPHLIAHPKSAAHGLNLQYGGHLLVWFSFDNNLEEFLQMNKRLARPGQKNHVIIHLLTLRKTVDEIVIRSLQSKDNAQNVFQRDLQKHIQDIAREMGLHLRLAYE